MIRREIVYAVIIGWAVGMAAHDAGPPSLQGFLVVGCVAGVATASWYLLDRWLDRRKQ